MSRASPYIVVLATGLLLGLAGCSSRPYYSDLPEPVAIPEPGASRNTPAQQGNVYTVKRGDTLHSIAFAAGTDWVTVARLNRIAAPYTIYPGQRLRLSASGAPVTLGMEPDRPAASAPGVASATRSAPAATPAPVRPVPTVAAPASRPSAPPPPPVASGKPGAWQWPSAGRVLQGYANGAQPHKGIDISGNSGDPVVAARSGTVVYAGSGVRGYGNLLIVKHDAHWLSAYAHNSRLLVAEGDTVRAGQRIAEMGDSGTDRTKLHFEVRRQGNPVDPMQVLPRR